MVRISPEIKTTPNDRRFERTVTENHAAIAPFLRSCRDLSERSRLKLVKAHWRHALGDPAALAIARMRESA
jgi:hypothetical protein